MMFFRKHVQKSAPINNTSTTVIIPSISLDTVNQADDDNEPCTTPTPSSTVKSPMVPTSNSEHLAEKHPGLLRLFDSNVCTVSIAIGYLFSTKEPTVQQYIGRKLFEYSHDEIDFYLPQLLNMYIHIQSISKEIHPYITTR